MHESARLGRIGELRAEAELLSRGCEVMRPSVDSGIDLYANGLGVQVKTRRAMPQIGRWVYAFNFNPTKSGCHLDADVFLFHGVDENLWWVVPKVVLLPFLATSNTVTLRTDCAHNPGGRGRPSRAHILHAYRDAWEVFDGEHESDFVEGDASGACEVEQGQLRLVS